MTLVLSAVDNKDMGGQSRKWDRLGFAAARYCTAGGVVVLRERSFVKAV